MTHPATADAVRRPATVHAAFEAQVDRAPNAAAVRYAGATASYADLDARANRLAVVLRERGVGLGVAVGICLERTPDLVVTLLAILKVGATYVPLEASYPAERLALLLRVTAAPVVITNAAHAAIVPAGTWTVVQLDDVTTRAELDAAPADRIESAAGPETRAYVMFTSGSTGDPKGVEVPHRAIVRLVCDVDYVALGPAHTVLHAAPLGFDASTFEIFGPLLTGGTCALHGERVPTPEGLARAIAVDGVTTMWLTAGLFNAVVDETPEALRGLRQLLTGGEALSVRHVRRAQQVLAGTQLINGYGPTETTTFAACYAIPSPLPEAWTSVPIGHAIRDTVLRVLDDAGRVVPAGDTGELYIGGAGVALGYLGRPDLTVERFVRDTWTAGDARLYRTGDLVRALPDGALEFVGRADDQVKISGYRIEPKEIAAALRRDPRVRDAAVVARAVAEGMPKRLVAYVVAAGDARPETGAVRDALRAVLPEYLVPSAFVWMAALPLTPNGKVDVRALPAPQAGDAPATASTTTPIAARDQADAVRAIAQVWGELLGVPQVDPDDNVFDLGASSLLVVRARARLQARLGVEIPVAHFFQHRTPRALAASLGANTRSEVQREVRRGTGPADGASEPVAIVGMAARFPGADGLEAFWRNLRDGVESIARFSDEELDAAVDPRLRADPQYVRARGVLRDVDRFDAGFFGLSPREAQLMDPQQRVFLELAWHALEHAGYVPERHDGPIGVFAGVYNNSYASTVLSRRQDLVEQFGAFNAMLLNEKDYVATRAAHRLGLTGPALSIHTACSTSLVTICQAVMSLRAGQCDLALAGGVSLTVPTQSGYLYQEGGMLSPDGRTRPFDAAASGTVFSDGAAVLALKRLSDAVRDGDTIHAVVRGVGLNNDGAAKASFTAPSVEGQAAAIAMAHADAGVAPRDVSYVEGHGTATPLGDPVEFAALMQVFGDRSAEIEPCALGSVKGNVGHTVIAAGAAGVIKTALALTHECLPGTVHFTAPNPHLGLDRSPFQVYGDTRPWARGERPRIAGVSSFGVGGTNAHVVLAEAPARAGDGPSRDDQLLVLSARSEAALERATDDLAAFLRAHPEACLADVAHTLRVGRRAFAHRRTVVAVSASEAAGALAARDERRVATRRAAAAVPGVVFAFPGQGAQYPRMGASLYATEPVYREAFDRCAESARPVLGRDLRDVLFADDADAAAVLRQTSVTQPALFATGYALAALWQLWGVRPKAMVGHSVGEFVAAAIAGVFSPEDGMRLVAERGRMMQQLPAGSMLSVRLGSAAVAPRLGAEMAIASENGPALCVVAGPTEAVARLQAELDAEGVACRPLHTSHAFHSPMMEPAVAPFLELVRGVALAAPTTPIVSSVTGTWLTPEQACDPQYWARHLRETVRFADAVRTVWTDPGALLLEVGPRATLSTLARQQVTDRATQVCVASLGDAGDPAREGDAVLAALGRLWTCGVRPDWDGFVRGETRRRVPVPSYPFERQRYWADPLPASAAVSAVAVVSAVTPLPPRFDAPLRVALPSPVSNTVRLPRLVTEVCELFESVSGVEIGAGDTSASFVELGIDSLVLTQVALAVTKRFGAKVTFRQMLEEYTSVERLATYLDASMPPEPAAAPVPAPVVAMVQPAASAVVPVEMPAMVAAPTVVAPVMMAGAGGHAVQQLIEQQLRLMTQQLALLGGSPGAGAMLVAPATVATTAAAPAPEVTTPDVAAPATAPAVAIQPAAATTSADDAVPLVTTGPQREFYDAKKAFGAAPRITHKANTELDARQRSRFDAFVRRYTARTAGSKRFTDANRARMADPRAVTGFRPTTKELVYPIVVERSTGSRMWDVDGNEYVDVLSGFGSNLFGWSAPFVAEAIKRQMELGFEVGPQHPLTAEVAELFAEVTGTERVAFCNTGSEAVLGAIRIARTVTGRDLVAVFSGSYHGINDEVIVRGTRTHRAVPAAPGILRAATDNVLVLDYGTPESMALLRERAHELAAIVVEPVQSRRPDFQPAEFLHELRTLTQEAGIVYIWDEIVTGFRAAPGGAQEHFGIRGDLATYGKIVGGGLPIGVIAGKREFMDALDGGQWQYGDASVPEVGVTYFAGTFVRHPLALAAARAVLLELKARGPELQRMLAERTRELADELNAMFRASGAPLEIRHFASVWKTFYTAEQPHGDLLFYMLRDRGVHVYDGFPCFMTASHSTEDLRRVVDAFTSAVAEMQEGGFLPARPAESAPAAPGAPPVPGARLGRSRDGSPAWFVAHPNEPGRYVQVGGPQRM
ncbi:MAG TPA: amino acid adenylation domain-containing protein [Gemmatirosa sp.]